MIIGESFSGDCNKFVKDVQFGMYSELLSILFLRTATRYLDSENVLDMRTELGKKVRLADSFDHRTLQWGHDQIAAWFRYSHASDLQPSLPGIDEFNNHEERVGSMWREFFLDEVNRLVESGQFVRNVLRAACYANPQQSGMSAEEELYLFFQDEYSQMYTP